MHGIVHTARALGVTPECVRDWERRGLIAPIARVAGRRVFTDDDIATLKAWDADRRAARPRRKEAAS